MNKLFKFIALSAAALATMVSCSKTEDPQSEDQKKQQAIAAVETQIAVGQKALNDMATIDAELTQYVADVKSGVTTLLGTEGTIPQSVADLESKQQQFSAEYKELKSYFESVSSDIKQFTTKADATADMFVAIQTKLSGINTNVLTLQSQMDVMSAQTSALSQSLSAETKSITDKLSACQTDIDKLQKDLQDLQGRVATLEKEYAAIISAVQSVVVVPDYNDGSVKVSDIKDNKFYFEVYPLTAADSLAKLGASAVSLDAVETEAKTKGSLEKAINLPVSAVSFDGKCLVITADGTGLSADIKSGVKTANARLRISDDKSKITRSSEYFQLTYKVASPEPSSAVKVIINQVQDYTEIHATLSAKAEYTSSANDNTYCGFVYSTTNENLFFNRDFYPIADTLKIRTLPENGKFSGTTHTLKSNTHYYCRAFVFKNDVIYYSDIAEFTTKQISATVTTVNATEKTSGCSATLTGVLVVNSTETFTKTAYFYYSSTETTVEGLKKNGTKVAATLLDDGSFSVLAKPLKEETTYYYIACAQVNDMKFDGTVKTFTTKSLPSGCVNLGLSVLWRQCNIGASKPEEYGRYFAWGDVTGQTWDGSKWSGGGFSTYPTYELDANNNLKPECDAAHVLLGGSWRMPTSAEQQELIDNCTCTWTDNYNGTGVAGRVFTSNQTGYTDKSIFLPAAGGGGSDLFYAVSYGYYWLGTFSHDSYACHLFFSSGYIGLDPNYRSIGFPVRPVSEY